MGTMDPIALVLEDMWTHQEYLRTYTKSMSGDNREAYLFELDGLVIDIDALTDLVAKDKK